MNQQFRTYLYSTITLFILVFGHNIHALSVSPAKIELDGDPGSVLTGTIQVHNDQPSTQNVYLSFENFEPGDDSGTPRFVGADGGLATWFTTPSSLELSPDERTEVSYRIQIPTTAEPGGYFAAVFFGNQPPTNSESQLSIGGRLGVLTLLRVNGDIPESAGISEFRSEHMFYTEPPVKFEYRFSNTGGDRVVPRGDIVIRNTFGSERGLILANPVTGSVLPSSSRRFQTVWSNSSDSIVDAKNVETAELKGFWNNVKSQWNNFAFGWYSATMNIGWGATDQGASATARFLILPWQLLVVVLAVLVVIGGGLRFWLRNYRAKLIRQIQMQSARQAGHVSQSKTSRRTD